MNENEISKVIVDAAIEVHRILGGPGLLESVYEESLVYELRQRGMNVKRKIEVPISYKGVTLSTKLELDVIVGDIVIVECKSVARYNTIFEAQLLTYLRLTDKRLGLVINFGEKLVSEGINRVVNRLPES